MTEKYTLTFKNATDLTLFFVVYQDYPLHSLDGVAWQVCPLPEQGASKQPSTDSVSWTMKYGIALTEFDETYHQYTITKSLDVSLGEVYAVTDPSGTGTQDITGTQIEPAGSSDQMGLKNQTKKPVNTGFTLGDKLIGAERGVVGGGMSLYNTTKSFHVMGSTSKVLSGEIIDLPERAVLFVLPEIGITFPDGVYEGTVEASGQNGSYGLHFTTQSQGQALKTTV